MLTWRENFYEQKKGQQFIDNIIDSNFSNILIMNWAHELCFVSALLEGVLKEEFKMTPIYLVFFPFLTPWENNSRPFHSSSYFFHRSKTCFLTLVWFECHLFHKARCLNYPLIWLPLQISVVPDSQRSCTSHLASVILRGCFWSSFTEFTTEAALALCPFKHQSHHRQMMLGLPSTDLTTTSSSQSAEHTHHNCPNNLTNCKLN